MEIGVAPAVVALCLAFAGAPVNSVAVDEGSAWVPDHPITTADTSVAADTSGSAATSDPTGRVTYIHPVDRPISGGFDLVDGQYGAGRRGVEYRTIAGDPVGSPAGGIVSFAGEVVGRISVTVTHVDGRRSTVTGLIEVFVAKGQIVLSGQVIGLAAPGMLLTIREGDVYIDPALLLPNRGRHSHLVPASVGRRWWLPLHSSLGPI